MKKEEDINPFAMFFISLISILIVLAAVGVITFVGGIIEGFVFMKLWEWFIVPTFAVPPLNLVVSMGITLAVSFVVFQANFKKETGDTDWSKAFYFLVFRPGLFLFIGWILHYYFM